MRPLLFLSALLFAAPACTAPSVVRVQAAAPRPTDPRLERIAWLPGDARDLAYFPASQSPLLASFKRWNLPLPPCLFASINALDGHYMVTALPDGKAANVFHGQLDRAEIESCVPAFFSLLGLRIGVVRDGAITEFAKEGGGRTFIGWSGDGWAVWHDDRARVERILRREGTLRSQLPAFERLIAHIDPQAPCWAISISDMGGALVGVPSLGYYMLNPELTAGILFASPLLAAQAVQAAQREMASPRWSEGARKLFVRLAPTVVGSEVRVETSKMIDAPQEVIEELTQAMKQRAESQRNGP